MPAKRYLTITIGRDGAVSLMGHRELVDAFISRCQENGVKLSCSHLSPCG